MARILLVNTEFKAYVLIYPVLAHPHPNIWLAFIQARDHLVENGFSCAQSELVDFPLQKCERRETISER